MDKKQILLVSGSYELKQNVEKVLGWGYNLVWEKSVHASFSVALQTLPSVIIFDSISLNKLSDFKNLKSFKNTHYLQSSEIVMWCDTIGVNKFRQKYDKIVDEFISNENVEGLIAMIDKISSRPVEDDNRWKEYFLGLFNLMPQPVLLLDQNRILAMNDQFKKIFKVEKSQGLFLTDFVNTENKEKVNQSLDRFAHGKHFKATAKTSLVLSDDKVRNAKINFSKLSLNSNNQFVMIIDFEENNPAVYKAIGTKSKQVDHCFKENSQLTNYSFTDREKEIISLLCKGYKTKEISKELFISPKTIEKHRANIVKRTNSETILESIIYAINHNLVDV